MSDDHEMKVLKRNGSFEIIAFDKILNRVKNLGNENKLQNINYSALVMKVIDQLYDRMPTSKIDEITAEQCASLSTQHHDYHILAGLIVISNYQKNTCNSFFQCVNELYKKTHGLISETYFKIVEKHQAFFEQIIDHNRDKLIDYFGFKTLERAYLIKINNKIVERIQYMWLRVCIQIHGEKLEKVSESYNYLSQKYFIHATPTLFNSGTQRPQLSSCFLLSMEDDSIDGIYNTLKECGQISKWAGGIGLHIHNIRCEGSHICGTNGTSNGITPMLRVFNATARYVDQGGGKRNGSFAIYLEPWHGDIENFLDLKKNHGDEEMRARDLFYALWIPDLFMKKVESGGIWHLFCPNTCNKLANTYGDEFEEAYNTYVSEEKYIKKIDARELWYKILDSQMETGTPYMLYKDACNKKSNQKNVGIIKSSNLCTEIIEYSDDKESAVCNLASIGLSRFVKEDKTFDYELLYDVTQVITENLNNVIDVNYYPTKKTKASNLRHRPIGIGVQGLADVFLLMDIAFYSDNAKEINRNIFETIYYSALKCSLKLAKKYGHYETFIGSPLSKGIFQFDLWNVSPSDKYDWNALKEEVIQHGVRNSLLLAPMPTASTSQILGNNECFEPYTSNIYSRRTLAGEFIMINKHLMKELCELNLWNTSLKNSIIENKGSIQHINGLSDHIKNKYRTVWEIPMKHVIDMAKDRGAFICQSQSMNLWVENPDYKILTSMHFYAWKSGLKTGMYYLRRKAKHQAQQFTIIPKENKGDESEDEECEMCSG
tara:strand:- start:1834 stop:4149 length:2316 start_codon:yes stop_codon:yes gene_type:complete